MTLEFFKHKYGYEIEGLWMPRVTAVTSLVSKAIFFAPQDSTNWGSQVHRAVEHLLKGSAETFNPAIAPSVRAFEHWANKNDFKLASKDAVEKRVFSPEHFYAGTLDFVGKVQGVSGVIDLKTSSALRAEYALQTAAYFSAYNSSAKPKDKVRTRWILRIDQYAECKGCFAKKREKSAKVRVSEGHPSCNHYWGQVKTEVECKELKDQDEDFEAFLAAKELWEWYNKDWLRKISNYPKKITQKVLI